MGKGLNKQREFIVFWRGYSGEGVKQAEGIHCVLEGVQWGRGSNKQREFIVFWRGTVKKRLNKRREFILFWRGYSGEGVKGAKGIPCVLIVSVYSTLQTSNIKKRNKIIITQVVCFYFAPSFQHTYMYVKTYHFQHGLIKHSPSVAPIFFKFP